MNAKKYDLATSHKNWKKFPAVSSDIITHHSSDKVSKVWFIELLPSIQRNDSFIYLKIFCCNSEMKKSKGLDSTKKLSEMMSIQLGFFIPHGHQMKKKAAVKVQSLFNKQIL